MKRLIVTLLVSLTFLGCSGVSTVGELDANALMTSFTSNSKKEEMLKLDRIFVRYYDGEKERFDFQEITFNKNGWSKKPIKFDVDSIKWSDYIKQGYYYYIYYGSSEKVDGRLKTKDVIYINQELEQYNKTEQNRIKNKELEKRRTVYEEKVKKIKAKGYKLDASSWYAHNNLSPEQLGHIKHKELDIEWVSLAHRSRIGVDDLYSSAKKVSGTIPEVPRSMTRIERLIKYTPYEITGKVGRFELYNDEPIQYLNSREALYYSEGVTVLITFKDKVRKKAKFTAVGIRPFIYTNTLGSRTTAYHLKEL